MTRLLSKVSTPLFLCVGFAVTTSAQSVSDSSLVSAMGNWLADATQAERAIAEIALAAYRYFDGLAHSNVSGSKKPS